MSLQFNLSDDAKAEYFPHFWPNLSWLGTNYPGKRGNLSHFFPEPLFFMPEMKGLWYRIWQIYPVVAFWGAEFQISGKSGKEKEGTVRMKQVSINPRENARETSSEQETGGLTM
jgi:hypothetical protein